MAIVVYDQYGRRPDDPGYRENWNAPEPYLVDSSVAGITYICYFSGALRAIRRVSETDGVTKIEWAYGAWEERTALEYRPINEYREIVE